VATVKLVTFDHYENMNQNYSLPVTRASFMTTNSFVSNPIIRPTPIWIFFVFG